MFEEAMMQVVSPVMKAAAVLGSLKPTTEPSRNDPPTVATVDPNFISCDTLYVSNMRFKKLAVVSICSVY